MASSFPSPIGGTTLSSDFAPSLVFAILFGLICPTMLYRVWIDKKTRCVVLMNAVVALVERPVVFSLRTIQSQDVGPVQASDGLTKYMQLSFALGYIALAQDLCKVLRSLIVNATCAPEPKDLTALDYPDLEDHPRIRHWTRRISVLYNFLYIGAYVPGLLSSIYFDGAIGNENPTRGDMAIRLRYASAIVHLLLTISMAMWAYWAICRLPRIKLEAAWVFIFVCMTLCVPGLYRLGVMYNRTAGTSPSMFPDTPGALNRPVDKALFYIFHMVPEVVFAITLFVTYNVRELFETGLAGDVHWKDLTPEQREEIERKKEAKEKKKQEKKAKKAKKKGLDLLVREV